MSLKSHKARARMHFIRVMRDKGWASTERTFAQTLDLVKDMKEELESGR